MARSLLAEEMSAFPGGAPPFGPGSAKKPSGSIMRVTTMTFRTKLATFVKLTRSERKREPSNSESIGVILELAAA